MSDQETPVPVPEPKTAEQLSFEKLPKPIPWFPCSGDLMKWFEDQTDDPTWGGLMTFILMPVLIFILPLALVDLLASPFILLHNYLYVPIRRWIWKLYN